MGNRIHIITKHVVEYGAGGFSWQHDELERLLSDNGCEVNGQLNSDCIGDWEIEEHDFQDAVKRIKKLSAKKIKSYFTGYTVQDTDKELKEYVVNLLQEFVDTGDHSNGYYHFSWF